MTGQSVEPAVTRAMAEMVVALGPEHLSPQALELVTQAFVDCLGCMLAGARQPESQIARGWVEALGSAGEATLFGTGARAAAAPAALANGVSAHALDYDDFVLRRMVHTSVSLVPALLALAERSGASGMDVILAYAAGYETAARIARRLNPDHYERGWHSTSTIGGLGTAAAAARLLGLDRDGVATAVAIAASSAGGLRANFGSMVKPLHAGNAAFSAVTAAELAARGFSASRSILDGPRSYAAVYGDADAGGLSAADFALDSLELAESGMVFKRYTCCGAMHAAIDATLELAAEHGLAPDDVARISCAVHPMAPQILIHHVAATPDEGRFCVEYSLAVALVDGDAGVAQYTEERIADARVQDVSRRVEVTVDESLSAGEGAATELSNSIVTLETRAGQAFTRRVKPHRPMSWAESERKFRSCAATVMDERAAGSAFALARRLPELDDVAALARAFAAPAP
jgi:2-methylcitrate dehydratase PrpD